MHSEFFELLKIYAWVLPAGILMAASLAAQGPILASKGLALQTLCLSQGAIVGVLFGMALSHENSVLPFATGMLVAFTTYQISSRLIRNHSHSEVILLSFYIALQALSFLITAVIPSLESHMSQIYFGDLATLSEESAIFTIGLALSTLAVSLKKWRLWVNEAFEQSVFGFPVSAGMQLVVSLVLVTLSIQLLGLLFTISMLFIPTVILSRSVRRMKPHLMLSSISAGSFVLIGFLVSLNFSTLPTVPTITIFMTLALGLIALVRARILSQN